MLHGRVYASQERVQDRTLHIPSPVRCPGEDPLERVSRFPEVSWLLSWVHLASLWLCCTPLLLMQGRVVSVFLTCMFTTMPSHCKIFPSHCDTSSSSWRAHKTLKTSTGLVGSQLRRTCSSSIFGSPSRLSRKQAQRMQACQLISDSLPFLVSLFISHSCKILYSTAIHSKQQKEA